jgi:ribose/xylose/arabinose/galactoside ABC-type transport system permease subunit
MGLQAKSMVVDSLRKGSILIIMALVIAVSAILFPSFYKLTNLLNILNQSSYIGIVSVGQTFVVLGGGIDLSVASVMSCINVMLASLTLGKDALTPQVILLLLLVGAIIGFINGVTIVKRKVPAFVITLGMGVILNGLRLILTNGAPFGYIPPMVRFLGSGKIGVIPVAFMVFLLVVILSQIALRSMVFGRQLYAVGVNEKAAHSMGVNTDRVRIVSYVVCSVLAALSAIILSGYINTADNWSAKGLDLDSVAAVVIGGTMLEGGKGGVVYTMAGVLLIALVSNLIVYAGLAIEMQLVAKALIFIIAVAIYNSLSKRNA